MTEYRVSYEIDVDVNTIIKKKDEIETAAIIAESALRHMAYRPAFMITHIGTGKKTLIDLETMVRTSPRKDRIILVLQKGCVELVNNPSGYKVILKDYDVQEVGGHILDATGLYQEREL
jgi:hypothetical protein